MARCMESSCFDWWCESLDDNSYHCDLVYPVGQHALLFESSLAVLLGQRPALSLISFPEGKNGL